MSYPTISDELLQGLHHTRDLLPSANSWPCRSHLLRVVGLTLEAGLIDIPLGSVCLILSNETESIEAEVVGFTKDRLLLMTTENTLGIKPGAWVIPVGNNTQVSVGEALLGHVLDGRGHALDGLGEISTDIQYPLYGKPINPLCRKPINEKLDVGVRAINALFSVGMGQRLGLFAGSGVGKSMLLGMMTHFTSADVIVVGLIGERGREVKEFIENILTEESLKRAVIVAAPADSSPLMRLNGALRATCIAEYFRDQGKNVLLLMDSLTRFAQAQRQLALAVGEPPATKGYPPSVFAKLAELIERSGNGDEGKGSITAFYTVLAEGDDQQDPIADAARSILDGHLVLSRDIAGRGIYPALDIQQSISRLMTTVASEDQQQLARYFKHIYSKYEENQDLIKVGAYQAGADPELDAAIVLYPKLCEFIKQGLTQCVPLSQSLQDLIELFSEEASG